MLAGSVRISISNAASAREELVYATRVPTEFQRPPTAAAPVPFKHVLLYLRFVKRQVRMSANDPVFDASKLPKNNLRARIRIKQVERIDVTQRTIRIAQPMPRF